MCKIFRTVDPKSVHSLQHLNFPGSIINIETLNVKFTWGKDMPDADSCYQEESGQRSSYSLSALRIFYLEKPESANETIGTTCILPA